MSYCNAPEVLNICALLQASVTFVNHHEVR